MAIRTCLVAILGLVIVTTGAAAPGNGRLAYYRNTSLFVSAADGSGETKLADALSFYYDHPATRPLWSPDGAHLAYLTEVRSPGLIEVVPAVIAADGGSPTRLADHGSFFLACWLDASTLVAVASRETPTTPVTIDQDLYAFGIDGAVRRLTTDGGTKSVSPQGCAPDGSEVAYVKQQSDFRWKAFVVHSDASTPSLLTPAGESDGPPSWSPLGDRLTFPRYGTSPGLYVSDPSGAGAQRLTTTSQPSAVSWSPNGTKILFTHSETDYTRCSRYGCPTATDVRVIDADGSREQVLADGGFDTGLSWSPDGTRAVFLRGSSQVFVMNADGSCKTLLPANVGQSFAWQSVPGKPSESAITCADLKVSTDVPEIDLPLHGRAAYTVTVVNQGNERASAVQLDQAAADGVAITSVESSQGACATSDGLHCALGALAVGASATVKIAFDGGDPGNTTLEPRASAPEPDGDPFDNSVRLGVSVFDCSILGTYGADTLYGTPARDRICGRFGNDTIYGNAGNDVIYGGEGADTIYGGKGRDVIYGGGGNDVILARDGRRDAIDCGPETDTAIVDRIDVVSHCRTVLRPKRVTRHRHPR